ncbi:MAG: RNA polymerase sigma-70 factor [Pedobacter sp.]|uniref:RNA polymerase sigma-70 factor n=1 Tax=Pedobacter sp. TaxID=1411316 RepID=UPI0028071253|nr:RNA polymerase sigma-70 factor [Pedobacter sp.]MDQ8004638.1 RNA polymerase sigma-70 factor [Pedobacter sp.]
MIDKGHTEAFTNFYTLYFKKLLLESDKYVKDIQVAEEIVQDVFVKIWERSVDLDQIQSLKSYLYRSVINSSINYVNRQKNLEHHHQKMATAFSEQDLEQLDEENELIVLLFSEIEKLPTKCREVFKLNRFERLKYREIAVALDISEKTVENHIANALKILKEAMLAKKANVSGLTNSRILSILFLF